MLVSLSNLNSRRPKTDPHVGEDTNGKDAKVVDEVIDYQEAQNFIGTCVDSGAEVTVIGMSQAGLYCMMSGTQFAPWNLTGYTDMVKWSAKGSEG